MTNKKEENMDAAIEESEEFLDMGNKIDFDGDVREIHSLGVESYAETIKIGKQLLPYKDKKKFSMEEAFEILDGEGIKSVSRLVAKTIDNTFPNKNQNFKNDIAVNYFKELIAVVLKVNMPKQGKDRNRQGVNLIRERIKKHDAITKSSKK